jgi:AcrR family transcriptional regulator
MLYMSSAPMATDADLTARARIRDAAIACFADRGVSDTPVRAIAAQAGVSPALVIHHFGSKDRLRVACDQHVAAIIRQGKQEAVAAGASLDPVAALRSASDGPPYLRYLARTLVDGSPHVAELIDEMVEDAVSYLDEGVAAGSLKPSDDQRGRAVVLVMWSLGSLVLHEHVARLTGADLVDHPADAQGWMLPAMELLTRGILDEALYEHYRDAFATKDEEG